jgi:hypothetical protein
MIGEVTDRQAGEDEGGDKCNRTHLSAD